MEEELSSDNLYVKRLLWQQEHCPQYVVMPSSMSKEREDEKEEDGQERRDKDEDDVKMDAEECENRNVENREEFMDDLRNNNGNFTLKQSSEMNWGNSPSKVDKENDIFRIMGSENRFTYRMESSSVDRFIPKRDFENWQTRFSMMSEHYVACSGIGGMANSSQKRKENVSGDQNRDALAYDYLLQNELLGASYDGIAKNQREDRKNDSLQNQKNLFHYRRKSEYLENVESTSPYSLSPVGPKSQKLLRSPRKAARKISRIPFKVLDAPELQDDFYLNLVDWSSQNMLAVGLGNSVYLWSACTSQVTRLCDFSDDNNTVTSVAWNDRGHYVAVGTHQGYVQIWDVTATKLVCKLTGHNARVGALAWNGESLSSGSRDRMIFEHDIRSPPNYVEKRLVGHRQEVCGLKWSPDNQYLASGGNDNRLFVWNQSSNTPLQIYTDHGAAVKAIAWSPHQHGLLASGGGTADRCIRFWNTLTGQAMQCVDTGSQVCNLAWSKHSSELVSTHGYSQNQILVWKYPALTQIAKLTGHAYRVLYLAMSPDGESIVTGAGDETLRFWNVFSKARSQKECRGESILMTGVVIEIEQ